MKYYFIILIVVLVSVIGSIVSAKNMDWYKSDKVQRPKLAPPDKYFGIVWTTIYTLYIITWISNKDKGFDDVFTISITINLLWTLSFFGNHNVETSKGIIVSLLIIVAYQFYQMYTVGSIIGMISMALYIGWLCFATYLNFNTKVLSE